MVRKKTRGESMLHNQLPIHVIFNIEDVLASQFNEKSIKRILEEKPELKPLHDQNLFIQAIDFYLLYPGVIELMQWLFHNSNIKVSFFNSGNKQKSDAFVQTLLSRALGDKYFSIKNDIAVYADENMIPSTKNENEYLHNMFDIRYGNNKKNLKTILFEQNLDNTLLIENDSTYIAGDQVKNVFRVKSIGDNPFYRFHHYAQKSPDYAKKDVFIINQIFCIAGMINKLYQSHGSLTENLMKVQYRLNSNGIYQHNVDLFKNREYYLEGLAVLQTINPTLEFYGGNLAKKRMDIKHTLFNKISHTLIKQSEELATDKLDLFINTYGNESFLELYENNKNFYRKILGFKARATASLLYIACDKNYLRLAEKLITYGVPINDGSRCEKKLYCDNISPLMIAAYRNNMQIVALLLKNQANLFQCNGSKLTVLMMNLSADIANMILLKAKEDECITVLLSMRDINGETAYENAVTYNNLDLLDALMKIGDWETCANLPRLLHHARQQSWANPKNHGKYNQLCLDIRSKLTIKRHSTLGLNMHLLSRTVEDSYQKIFGEGYSQHRIVDCENSAFKIILSEAYSLLSTPEKCIKYLKFLNRELTRYYKLNEKYYAKPFPSVDPATYTMTAIDGVYYPIPNESYDLHNNKKYQALQKVLIAHFQKYGLADKGFKWIGFIPSEIADLMVMEGDFVLESKLGPGLFHGPLAHMLQAIILIYAIENNDIPLDFAIDGKVKRFTVKEVLAAFVIMLTKDNMAVWGYLRDERDFQNITFTDPHRLCSIIMYYAIILGLQVLGVSLIDSFCKGYIKLLKAYESIPPHLKHKLDEFAKEMNDILSSLFTTPDKLLQYAVHQENKRELNSPFGVEGNYAVIELDYKADNPYYQPNHYSDSINDDTLDIHVNTTIKADSVSNLLNQSLFKKPMNIAKDDKVVLQKSIQNPLPQTYSM